jgi:bacterioferritin-associated ferredoxin
MIVCQCAGVTDRDIVRLADAGASVEEIKRRTGAGQCCTSCRDDVAALASQARPRDKERVSLPTLAASPATTL